MSPKPHRTYGLSQPPGTAVHVYPTNTPKRHPYRRNLKQSYSHSILLKMDSVVSDNFRTPLNGIFQSTDPCAEAH